MNSLNEVLQRARVRLEGGPHRNRARQDAETLLLYLLEKDKVWLMTHSNVQITNDQANSYAKFVERRCTGEPIQYIIGETEFYGLPFRVTHDVLIPRPETEHLVEKVIELSANFALPHVVDIGTGSGAIAVALAHHLPQANITAIDISNSALFIARENAKRNAVRLRFLEGDLLTPVQGEQFDIIVSNPPYVPTIDRDSLSVEVREHEPALALFAGADGLDIYRRLIPAAYAALVPGGSLALEIGYAQSEAIAVLLAAFGFGPIGFVPDLQGIPRVAFAQRPPMMRYSVDTSTNLP